MKTRTPTVIALTALLLALAASGCAPSSAKLAAPAPAAVGPKPLVVFLARHAEKVDASTDPPLSPAGRERADALDALLRSTGIEHVHSTSFVRTTHTAAPIARRHGVDVQPYNHRDLPALVELLRRAGGRHLVIGHSNTTPAVVRLLGGTPGPPIDEPAEYDRLYVVTLGADGTVTTVLLRYGRPYAPPGE